MQDQITLFNQWFADNGQLAMVTGLVILLTLSWMANFLVKHILLRSVFRLLNMQKAQCEKSGLDLRFVARLANVVPALVISTGISIVPHLPDAVKQVVYNVCNAFMVLTVALAFSHFLTMVNSLYSRRPEAKNKPIKGYIQLLKIIIFAIAIILMIATLLDRSPFILLSGLGAMAAVLMLIFQDTILSMVASVQISSNDLLRVGDWVEMPDLNADGDVIDIALHTVQIQNWDKTITTIPTRRFLTDPFKNWRGMKDSGGRRIKRSIMLDQQSVHFLTEEEGSKLKKFRLLSEYLTEKEQEIRQWNEALKEQGKEPVNTRRITNLGTFRAYVVNYLKSNSNLHQHMTLMVRQLAPTADGLPLEIYCFTTTTAWVAYEGIQSDIFDHLLAILPEFGLRVYQHPSGMDVRSLQLNAGV